eukprot:Skav218666  [mRNA]  locus=scaffold5113:17317:24463:+ [translate_table: standard]
MLGRPRAGVALAGRMFQLDEPAKGEGHMQDARLLNFDVGGQSVEVSLPKDDGSSAGTLTLQEKHASLWRIWVRHIQSRCVQSSELPDLAPLGALVQLYDATPKQLAPPSAETLGAVKSSLLQSSGMRWNGVTGFSPESCPRDFDGVHVAYTAPWRRDAVFDYKLSDEAIKLGEMRERQPAVVAQRALGVGIQLWTWALVYSYYQGPEDGARVDPATLWGTVSWVL